METIRVAGYTVSTYPVDTDYDLLMGPLGEQAAIGHGEDVVIYEVESKHPLKKCADDPDWQPYMVGPAPGEGDRGWFALVPKSIVPQFEKKFKGWTLGDVANDSVQCPDCGCKFVAA